MSAPPKRATSTPRKPLPQAPAGSPSKAAAKRTAPSPARPKAVPPAKVPSKRSATPKKASTPAPKVPAKAPAVSSSAPSPSKVEEPVRASKDDNDDDDDDDDDDDSENDGGSDDGDDDSPEPSVRRTRAEAEAELARLIAELDDEPLPDGLGGADVAALAGPKRLLTDVTDVPLTAAVDDEVRRYEETLASKHRGRGLKGDGAGAGEAGRGALLHNPKGVFTFDVMVRNTLPPEVRESGADAVAEAMLEVQTLRLASLGMPDCDMLECMTAVSKVFLEHNMIRGVTGLAMLTGLEVVSLRSNHVVDIEPLRHLNALRCLDLRDNEVKAIVGAAQELGGGEQAEVSYLPETLEELDLRGNPVCPLPASTVDLDAAAVTAAVSSLPAPSAAEHREYRERVLLACPLVDVLDGASTAALLGDQSTNDADDKMVEDDEGGAAPDGVTLGDVLRNAEPAIEDFDLPDSDDDAAADAALATARKGRDGTSLLSTARPGDSRGNPSTGAAAEDADVTAAIDEAMREDMDSDADSAVDDPVLPDDRKRRRKRRDSTPDVLAVGDDDAAAVDEAPVALTSTKRPTTASSSRPGTAGGRRPGPRLHFPVAGGVTSAVRTATDDLIHRYEALSKAGDAAVAVAATPSAQEVEDAGLQPGRAEEIGVDGETAVIAAMRPSTRSGRPGSALGGSQHRLGGSQVAHADPTVPVAPETVEEALEREDDAATAAARRSTAVHDAQAQLRSELRFALQHQRNVAAQRLEGLWDAGADALRQRRERREDRFRRAVIDGGDVEKGEQSSGAKGTDAAPTLAEAATDSSSRKVRALRASLTAAPLDEVLRKLSAGHGGIDGKTVAEVEAMEAEERAMARAVVDTVQAIDRPSPAYQRALAVLSIGGVDLDKYRNMPTVKAPPKAVATSDPPE